MIKTGIRRSAQVYTPSF